MVKFFRLARDIPQGSDSMDEDRFLRRAFAM